MYLVRPALVVFAIAAGGGMTGASAAPAASTVKVCSSPVRIQLFGDSIQEQQFDAVQKLLDQSLGPGAAVVENHGLSGTTAADFPFAKVKPGAITVVNYGVNDIRAPGASVEAYKARLRQIAPIYFETPSPPFDGYAQAMRDVAAELGRPVIDVSAKVRAMPDWQAHVFDGVHPDPLLYQAISRDMVVPALAEAVKRMACRP